MGRYINTLPDGSFLPITGKADALLQGIPGTKEVPANEIKFQPDFVVVVENGPFDAAGYAYDKREYMDFTDTSTDRRSRRYLIVPGASTLAQ